MKNIYKLLILIMIMTSCEIEPDSYKLEIKIDKDYISTVNFVKGMDYNFTSEYDGSTKYIKWYINGEYISSGETLTTQFDTADAYKIKAVAIEPEEFLTDEVKSSDEILITVVDDYEKVNKITELNFERFNIKTNGSNIGIMVNSQKMLISDDGGVYFNTITFPFNIYDFSILTDCDNFLLIQDSPYTVKAYDKTGNNSSIILDETSLIDPDHHNEGFITEEIIHIKTAYYKTYIITKDANSMNHHYVLTVDNNSFSLNGFNNNLSGYVSYSYYDMSHNLRIFDDYNYEITVLNSSNYTSKEYKLGLDDFPLHSHVVSANKENIVISDVDNDTYYIHDKYGWTKEEFSYKLSNIEYSNNIMTIYNTNNYEYIVEDKYSGFKTSIFLGENFDYHSPYIDNNYFIYITMDSEIYVLKKN